MVESQVRAPALLRPYAGGFAAVVILQVIGAVAGLAPLLAVAELGRTLLAPGPVAIDTETMGLVTPRDRQCLVQISDGGGDERGAETLDEQH